MTVISWEEGEERQAATRSNTSAQLAVRSKARFWRRIHLEGNLIAR
jgi:hypothetical protein